MGLEQPIFSPDLLLWKTSLNEDLIPTGSIGVNSDLVEVESNFPRFKLLFPLEETEEELLARVKKEGEKLLKSLNTEKVFQVNEQNAIENNNELAENSLETNQESSHSNNDKENLKEEILEQEGKSFLSYTASNNN